MGYKFFEATALEQGRNVNSFLGSDRFTGFILAVRMKFFKVSMALFTWDVLPLKFQWIKGAGLGRYYYHVLYLRGTGLGRYCYNIFVDKRHWLGSILLLCFVVKRHWPELVLLQCFCG